MMRIGYACLTIGVAHTAIQSCMLRSATSQRLAAIIAANLEALDQMIDYNIANGIMLFRISSDIIPFGSNPVNQLDWATMSADHLRTIGDKIRRSGLRVSMHPGQYTVLNSPDPDIAARAADDLRYHTRFLDSLGVSCEHKIILHIGGVYGDKKAAIDRFAENFRKLDESVRSRLVIENDDKSYTITDVLAIGRQLRIPVVFDNLHHAVNGGIPSASDAHWIAECAATWQTRDGVQKIHYSQQDPHKRAGSHAGSIAIRPFLTFVESLGTLSPDIMLEVKDKNLSAVKCVNCLTKQARIVTLEKEWRRYKYKVLESSPTAYNQIRALLKDKSAYPALAFYDLIEGALACEFSPGNCVNAAQHVWGYFKDQATATEMADFQRRIAQIEQAPLAVARLKRLLWKLAIRYQQSYLLQSLYFNL